MALHRVVVSTQVGHEAETRHDDVVIVRLAVGAKIIWLVECQKYIIIHHTGRSEMCFLHVGHEKNNELVDVVCRLEDASVVSEFLQHLQTLNDTNKITITEFTMQRSKNIQRLHFDHD